MGVDSSVALLLFARVCKYCSEPLAEALESAILSIEKTDKLRRGRQGEQLLSQYVTTIGCKTQKVTKLADLKL